MSTWFYGTENKTKSYIMTKRCKKKDYTEPENPKYECEKCHRKAKSDEKLCKPESLKTKPKH